MYCSKETDVHAMAKVSTKGIRIKHSRTARNNEIDFVLDSKIEYITKVHGENQTDRNDPHVEGKQIWPRAKKIRGRSASGRLEVMGANQVRRTQSGGTGGKGTAWGRRPRTHLRFVQIYSVRKYLVLDRKYLVWALEIPA